MMYKAYITDKMKCQLKGFALPVEAKPLFRPDVIRSHLAAFSLPDCIEPLRRQLADWASLLDTGRAKNFKEQELLPDFLTLYFYGVLGYTGPADNPNRYTISREHHVQVDGKFADAVLGEFNGTPKYAVALEGKGPKDPLDRPFGGRRMSAVDQAYRYAINLPCDWVIVTSIRQIRLYYKGCDQYTYELFDTERLADDENHLKRFVFLLGAERVVPSAGPCHLDSLWGESEKVGRELTKEFYLRYADMRQDAFEQLCRDNSGVSRHEVLSATQKLLDRVLFCAFCEDRGLLPVEMLRKAYEHRDPFNPHPIWENFRGLFQAVNRGNAALGIHAYNGGLFADDPLLDRLIVSDDVCRYFRDLGDFDYRPAHQAASYATDASLIDVDILGHIFEQSITDLERLRNELDGLAEPVGADKHKTRRKKEGAFYTPAFITRYIVEQALGGVLRDRFEQLRQQHAQDVKGTARTSLADPGVYQLDKLNKPQRAALIQFWEVWQDCLASIRLLDPACGSGAFLIEAFDQLHAEYLASNDRLQELRGHRSLFDLDRRILEHNLYGVDLNDEAIEICRLSLWIKTAQRGKTLASLDHPIRVGNSVVADRVVHPKAFDWQAAFPEIFKDGGFDVVVGNPPYIRQEWLAPYKPYWQQTFASFHGVADIFTYFYELGVKLLREGGRLGFITSGSWVRGNFGGPLRQFLTQNAALESLVDFGEFQPFEEAEMIRPTITVLRKQQPGGNARLFKWLTTGVPPENLSDVIQTAPMMSTAHLGSSAWKLDADAVRALREKMLSLGKSLRSCTERICRGVVTGLNDVFVISKTQRDEVLAQDPNSSDIIKPLIQGTHMRPWYIEQSDEYLIFTRRGIDIERYPAVYEYLSRHRDRLEPRPSGWAGNRKWPGRKPGAYQWYEIQDTVDYWEAFEQPKIVWPDISKLPRFSIDTEHRYLGNTGFVIPLHDFFLLGVLSSWATWFSISKTAQPLRLRGNRWQYRLFTQFMEEIPIPDASDVEKELMGDLARKCSRIGEERYELQSKVQRRLITAFGQDDHGASLGKLNNKAQAWWELPYAQLGAALKTSFKLRTNPLKNPRTADQWESYLAEKRDEVDRQTRELADAEAELNGRVYTLFHLTQDEIELLQREVEH